MEDPYKNPEEEVVSANHSKEMWRQIFRSSHKTSLYVSKEERAAVNNGAAEGGFKVREDEKSGKKVKGSQHFR